MKGYAMDYSRPVVLTIAGSDSGGGAGIQADLKTITVHGCFGISALTALTAQNTTGVQGIFPISPDFIQQQLTSLFSDFTIAAAKTGMLHSAEIVQLVAEMLRDHPGLKLVCDPVMVAKSGDRLLEDSAIHALKEDLIPLATVVTPNIPEAEVLWEHPIHTEEDKKQACRALHNLGVRSVLLKGGHETGSKSTDLFFDGTSFHRFSSPRYATPHTHGTGCTTSAAIAANLALGKDLVTAIRDAKRYIDLAIRFSLSLGHGHGPTDHFAMVERTSARYSVIQALSEAADYFCSHAAGHLIPEVQTNLAYALPFAMTHEEVAAIPGRIVNLKGKPHTSGCPAFGASRHIANIVLTVLRFSPAHRSVMNIRYDPSFLANANKIGFEIRSFDRMDEPATVKNQEGSTLEWGTREVLTHTKTIPDLIYDTGDMGKEPMIRVIARTPKEAVTKALRVGGVDPH